MAHIKDTANRLIQHLRKENPVENIINPNANKTSKNPISEIDAGLKVIQWNSRKMRGKDKQNRIKTDVKAINPDMFFFQETNLNRNQEKVPTTDKNNPEEEV